MTVQKVIQGVLISAGGMLLAAFFLSQFQDVAFVDKLREAFDR